MSELTYHKDGLDVKTANFLKNRGSCCKTSCIHCPYGFTLKKEGLELISLTDQNFPEAKLLTPNNDTGEINIAANLLASAFGGSKPKPTLTLENKESYLLVKIKGEICALVRKSGSRITEIHYKEHFDNQGITKDVVASFL
jgi:hypothetical protein